VARAATTSEAARRPDGRPIPIPLNRSLAMQPAITEQRADMPSSLKALYAPVAGALSDVEDLLAAELSSGHAFVDGLIRHGFRLGGKKLRPALVLLSGQATGSRHPALSRLAGAVELIHVATLVHDDVLDEADLRRHLATVNARWDNETSVLLGDYLLARSICLAASIDSSSGEVGGEDAHLSCAFACRAIAEAARVMCEGELRQAASRGNFQIDEQEYLDIIAGKTAALIACSCQLGAHYADAEPDVVERLVRYGHNLGIAFQIADDLLDMTGDEAVAGKSLGTDLDKQKPTLPLIHVMQQASAEERRSLQKVLTGDGNHRRKTLQPWFERYGAVEYARRRAAAFAQAARREIEPLDRSPAAEALRGLTRFVVDRES